MDIIGILDLILFCVPLNCWYFCTAESGLSQGTAESGLSQDPSSETCK